MVARLGGDEFAILVEGADGLDGAREALAARMLEELGKPMWIAGRELFPSASIGIALWQPRYRNGEELLRDADAAMYRAKAQGRDRSALFDEAMRAEAMRLLDLEADLRRAINNDAFVPHFQPIVRLADGAVVGHEALLRWHHELRGLLPPAEFIGVGEDSGLIEQVDWLMYERVFDWLTRHHEGYVSINVSPRHFRSPAISPIACWRCSTLPAPIRAGCASRSPKSRCSTMRRASLRTLNVLREHGVLAQLDDFGTGFSALSYLHRFPIQALKIDRSFVAGLGGEMHAESLALVRAILALAGTLGIDTIGEGVETDEQREILQRPGLRLRAGLPAIGRTASAELAPLTRIAIERRASRLEGRALVSSYVRAIGRIVRGDRLPVQLARAPALPTSSTNSARCRDGSSPSAPRAALRDDVVPVPCHRCGCRRAARRRRPPPRWRSAATRSACARSEVRRIGVVDQAAAVLARAACSAGAGRRFRPTCRQRPCHRRSATPAAVRRRNRPA